jgi:hypothetical protein
MKTQYIKTIGSTLIVGAFLFLAFGSDDSGSSYSPSSSSSSSSSKHDAPKGYHKGGSCNFCSGTGYKTTDGPNWKKGNVCASCNAKGYKWVKD